MHIKYIFGLLALFLAAPVAAQDITYFEPQIYNIELSGYEPLPPGIGAELAFGDYGAGPGDEDQPEGLHWSALPPERPFPAPLMGSAYACGYPEGEIPYATLTYPDGGTYEVMDSDGFFDDGCWGYTIRGEYGMQIGDYTLVLDHALGTLSTIWTVDYPRFLVEVEFTELGDDVRQIALMGFAPYETVLIHFYSAHQDDLKSYYAASRTVEADGNGAVWIVLETSRSAPFHMWDIGLTLDAYSKYFNPYTMQTRFAQRYACPNSLLSQLAVDGQGYVMPGDSNRVRDVPEGNVIGSLPPDTVFYVVDGPSCGDSDGLLWWRVQTKDGLDGWTVESDSRDYWLAPLL